MLRPRILLALGLLVPFGCKDDEGPGASDGSTGAPASTGQTTAAPTGGTTAAPPGDSTTATPTGGSEGADSTGAPAPAECGTESASALALCVEAGRIEDDVSFVADIRTPGDPHWLAVQEMCADRLEMLGFEVELHAYATGVNVLGRRPGTVAPQEVVLVGAHYDHIPACLGADDNASGVAGALEAARVLAEVQTERTLAVACWDEEELGLVGSEAWVLGGQDPAETVVAYFNYDMIGYATEAEGTQTIPTGFDLVFPEQYGQIEDWGFRGDFIVVVADDLAEGPFEAYRTHAAALELPEIGVLLDGVQKNSDLFSDLRRSDHASFWAQDLPALFFTDSGEFRHDSYHCLGSEDTVDSLDFEFARKVVGATVGAMADAAVLVP